MYKKCVQKILFLCTNCFRNCTKRKKLVYKTAKKLYKRVNKIPTKTFYCTKYKKNVQNNLNKSGSNYFVHFFCILYNKIFLLVFFLPSCTIFYPFCTIVFSFLYYIIPISYTKEVFFVHNSCTSFCQIVHFFPQIVQLLTQIVQFF